MWTHTLLMSNTWWGVQWCTRGRTAGVTPRLELSASSEIRPASSWAEEDPPCTPEGGSGQQLLGNSTRNTFRDSSMKGNSREASSQSAVKIMRNGIKAAEHVCYITPSFLPDARSSSGLLARCLSPVRERRRGRSRIRRCWSRHNPLWTENTVKTVCLHYKL